MSRANVVNGPRQLPNRVLPAMAFLATLLVYATLKMKRSSSLSLWPVTGLMELHTE